jgi:RNA polymerase sigma factor (sigma-70 family)
VKTIVERGQLKEMTFEEVYTQYQQLIRKMTWKWRTIEDTKQIAEIELWRAYQSYNPELGVSFTHYAEQVIDRRFLRLYRDTQYAKRKGELYEYSDKMGDKSNSFNFDLGIDIKTILDNLSSPQKEVAMLTYNGYSQTEIARHMHTTQTTVWRRLQGIRKQLIAIC